MDYTQNPTMLRQVKALSLTKYKQFFRSGNTVFCSLVMPIVLLFIGCLLSFLYKPSTSDLSSLGLSTSIYGGKLPW